MSLPKYSTYVRTVFNLTVASALIVETFSTDFKMTASTKKTDLQVANPQSTESISLGGRQAKAAANQPLAVDALERSECSNVDLNDLIVDLTPMLTRLVGSEIHLQHELDDGIRAVWGDASLLEQIVINLTVNARDAMPGGGTLSITTEVIKDMLGGHRTPKGVRLIVSDSGVGTDASNLVRSLELDLTSKPISTGLMTANSIAQIHNGIISMNSEVGHGTDVCVELPYSTQALEHVVPHLLAQAENTPTILLAEEVYGARSRVYSILTKAGYQVVNAHDGQNAIDMLSLLNNKIDLCLFDVSMPEINGSQAYEYLRRRKLDVPVIFIVGSPYGVADEHSDLQHLFKPFSRANILSRIKSCLGKADVDSPISG